MTHFCDEGTARKLKGSPLPRSISSSEAGETTDGRLLDRFIVHRDQSAFAEIVRRHGPMVLGVCQRVLDHRQDAEDCFQAAFMVLVRKATTIIPRDMVGNWLYGVAYRTALEARKLTARRRNLEKKKTAMPHPETNAELWQELKPVLDQELNKLPDKYRVVVVTCDLEGKTRSEAAELLQLPEGTVASRLARGRAILAKRLHKHRILVGPIDLANVMSERASLKLPEPLLASTANLARDPAGHVGVALLADAVVRAMYLAKLKVAVTVMCILALIGLGVTALVPAATPQKKHEGDVKVPLGPKKEKRRLSECIVRKIDVDKLELAAEDAAAEMHRVRVDQTAKVVMNGKEVKLTDLKPGAIVNIDVVRGADGVEYARRIELAGQSLSGIVQSVSVKDDAVTIQLDGVADAVGKENTYAVDPSVKICIDGKDAKLGEVAKGMSVNVQVAAGADRVVAITSPKR